MKEREWKDRQIERQQQESDLVPSSTSEIFPQTSSSEEIEDCFEPVRQPQPTYSLLKVPRLAMELIRGDVSSNLGASIANGFLLDLQDMGLLHPNLDLDNIIIDKSKIDREKARMKTSSHKKHSQEHNQLSCIGVDCRIDRETLKYDVVRDENGEEKWIKSKGPERHLTFTREMGLKSEYLTHRAIPNVGATGVVLTEHVDAVLNDYNSVDTVVAVVVDNTSINTGCEAGLISVLEKTLKRKIHTIGCSLHQNELPFRAIFKLMDGTTRSPTTFIGPLGKLCGNNYQDRPQVEFPRISGSLDNFQLTAEEIEDLSCDQRLLLEYALGISRGEVDPRYAAWKIGPLNQARWLTLAIRLMCLWTRGVYPYELSDKLQKIVKCIVEVYSVSWFEIKRDNKFSNQPLYIFNMIQRIKQQSEEIRNVALENLKHNAFGLLPENILFSMLKSNELEVREEAIKKILSIR